MVERVPLAFLGHLLHSVRTGQHAFSHAHGMGVFDYLRKNADFSAVFNAMMTAGPTPSGSAIVEHYDFSDIRKIVDVGGGHGFTLATILVSNPPMHGVLYDLPEVVAGADQILDAGGSDVKLLVVVSLIRFLQARMLTF